MAEFLRTKGILSGIEDLITEAKSKIVFVSPYLQISPDFLSRISDAVSRGITITVIFGKKEMTSAEFQIWNGIPGIEIRFLKNLHAKCYYNGEKLILASMNLYQFSEANVEMGILLDHQNDLQAFEKARKEIDFILAGSILNSLGFQQSFPFISHTIPIKNEPATAGYCIRCHTEIPHHIEKPLCKNCFEVWNQYRDPEYDEKYCHTCGHKDLTSKDYPECNNCYSRQRQTGRKRKTG